MERKFWLIYQKKKKSSAEKLESLWKQWLNTKEVTAKVSYSLGCFIYSFVLLLFSKFSNHASRPPLRQCWQAFQQRALAPLRVGGTILKMAALSVPKKACLLATETKTCISVQANLPSDQEHLTVANVLPARMLPDKTIAYQNLNSSKSHAMKEAKAEWKEYLSLSFSSL